MRKNITLNKYYKNFRNNVFNNLEIAEFMEVYIKDKKLKTQYKLLQICYFLEKIKIIRIEIPLLKFFTMLIDFIRWKIYDFIISLINGRTFNLYGVTCFCGRQGSGKTLGVVRELEKVKTIFPNAIICTNIDYVGQDLPLTSWIQLLELRNGEERCYFCN